MTPGARVAAAISVLDEIRAGRPAEAALTGWARGARYAGSGDRAAVRDHVFDVLRRRRSCAAWGGGETGRGLMIGLLRMQDRAPEDIFNGSGHAPPPLSDAEAAAGCAPRSGPEALDLPDWLWRRFEASLGAQAAPRAAERLRERAPVMLRLNPRRGTAEETLALLAGDGILAERDPVAPGALKVTQGARKLTGSGAYRDGRVEVQDGASQAAMAALAVPRGARVLDYCAGGGGKVLALAARADARWFAHDAAPRRMRDLPGRARRAGVQVTLQAPADLRTEGYDLVLCDVPCSGSGTWRRTPDAKWRLTPDGLAALEARQQEILAAAERLVTPGGMLAYSTCSVLQEENEMQVAAFLAERPGWREKCAQRWPVSESGDGFYLSVLLRN